MKRVSPSSASAKEGRLCQGDRFIVYNQKLMANLSQTQCLELLNQSVTHCQFKVLRTVSKLRSTDTQPSLVFKQRDTMQAESKADDTDSTDSENLLSAIRVEDDRGYNLNQNQLFAQNQLRLPCSKTSGTSSDNLDMVNTTSDESGSEMTDNVGSYSFTTSDKDFVDRMTPGATTLSQTGNRHEQTGKYCTDSQDPHLVSIRDISNVMQDKSDLVVSSISSTIHPAVPSAGEVSQLTNSDRKSSYNINDLPVTNIDDLLDTDTSVSDQHLSDADGVSPEKPESWNKHSTNVHQASERQFLSGDQDPDITVSSNEVDQMLATAPDVGHLTLTTSLNDVSHQKHDQFHHHSVDIPKLLSPFEELEKQLDVGNDQLKNKEQGLMKGTDFNASGSGQSLQDAGDPDFFPAPPPPPDVGDKPVVTTVCDIPTNTAVTNDGVRDKQWDDTDIPDLPDSEPPPLPATGPPPLDDDVVNIPIVQPPPPLDYDSLTDFLSIKDTEVTSFVENNDVSEEKSSSQNLTGLQGASLFLMTASSSVMTTSSSVMAVSSSVVTASSYVVTASSSVVTASSSVVTLPSASQSTLPLWSTPSTSSLTVITSTLPSSASTLPSSVSTLPSSVSTLSASSNLMSVSDRQSTSTKDRSNTTELQAVHDELMMKVKAKENEGTNVLTSHRGTERTSPTSFGRIKDVFEKGLQSMSILDKENKAETTALVIRQEDGKEKQEKRINDPKSMKRTEIVKSKIYDKKMPLNPIRSISPLSPSLILSSPRPYSKPSPSPSPITSPQGSPEKKSPLSNYYSGLTPGLLSSVRASSTPNLLVTDNQVGQTEVKVTKTDSSSSSSLIYGSQMFGSTSTTHLLMTKSPDVAMVKKRRTTDGPFQVEVLKGMLGLGITTAVHNDGVRITDILENGPVGRNGNIR